MNFSTLVGLIFAAVAFFGTLFLTFDKLNVLVDGISILMVFGGTLAATLICFPLKDLLKMFKVFFRRMLGLNKKDYVGLVRQVVLVSREARRGKTHLEACLPQLTDPFLKEAVELLFWGDTDISKENMRQVLETRAQTHYEEYMDDAETFRTVSKFPPAFGLMGTTIGMIALLQGLNGENMAATVGPSMAIALITTLYGLVISNFLLIPIAENLTKQTKEDFVARLMVVEGIMMIYEDQPTLFVQENLKSFLLPTLRNAITLEQGHQSSSPKVA